MEKESGGRPAPLGAAGGLQYDCVLLSGPTSPLPSRLIEGLRARGARVRVAPDAPSAMVELAAGESDERPLPRVLIVNEPASHRALATLLAAVRRYYPQARCWRYEAGLPARLGLRPFDEPPAPAPARTALRDAAPSLGSFRDAGQVKPEPRTTPPPPASPPPSPQVGTPAPAGPRRPRLAPAADMPLVSKEELAMLLGYAESQNQPLTPPDEQDDASRRRASRSE